MTITYIQKNGFKTTLHIYKNKMGEVIDLLQKLNYKIVAIRGV